MSQPNLESVNVPSVINKKPQLTVYTMMLIVSLIALLITILFLFLEWRAYEYDSGSAVASITSPWQQLYSTNLS
ncbi:MAG: hypothetical protein CMJ72_10880 [Planctomycetaceae bacterium]|nr:hypothetical protein [Planctomycetaceae bacterium]